MSQVVVVGAGLSGLSVAYHLQRLVPDAGITLLEQRTRPGGTIWTEDRDGFRLEHGPNGFLDSKPSTITLCRDLGLGERLIPGSDAAAKNRFLFHNNTLHRLPNSPGSFVRSGVLSWRGKLSLLLERVRRSRPPAYDESIAHFVRRRTSREIADVLADAFVTGIFAGDPELLSVRAALPRLHALEQQYGSILKGFSQEARERRAAAKAAGTVYQRPGKMWSFREGLRVLVETLGSSLKRPPLLGVNVRRLERRDTWIVSGEGKDEWAADAVVLACPAYQQAAILHELDEGLAETIGAIPYNRVAVVLLGYRQSDIPMSLDGFGFLTPGREKRDLLGVQWCSSIYPDRAPAGCVLLRAMCGGWRRPELVGWSDERLLEAVRAELRIAQGISAPPVFHQVVRWERAIPQYHVGHLHRVAAIEERLQRHPGLFVGGNAYRGVAMNDCTEQGELLAGRVASWLSANGGAGPHSVG